jgi:hypothetical protein
MLKESQGAADPHAVDAEPLPELDSLGRREFEATA